MLTKEERSILRAKIREVEEAIEDLRACITSANIIPLDEMKARSWRARMAIAEMKRYCEEDLS